MTKTTPNYDFYEELGNLNSIENQPQRGTIVAVNNYSNDPSTDYWIIGVYEGYSYNDNKHIVHTSSSGDDNYFKFVRLVNDVWPFAKI